MEISKLLFELEAYVNHRLSTTEGACYSSFAPISDLLCEEAVTFEVQDFIELRRKASFSHYLLSLIDKSGKSDSEIYHRAGIDRRHFSKIRSNPSYKIGKNAVIALGLALELNLEEADELLRCAGFTLSDSETFDLVIQFCYEREIYDLMQVNEMLDYFSLKPLG